MNHSPPNPAGANSATSTATASELKTQFGPLPGVPLIVGVTGHRDLLEQERSATEQRVRGFFAGLRQRYPDLPIVLLTSLAEGADQLAARIAVSEGCRILNVLPMPARHYREDFAGAALEEFETFLAAHPTIELPFLPSGAVAAGSASARQLQYERLGVFLAAHSHILLALWDGTYNEAVGGTGQVVRFHQRDVSALTVTHQERSRLDVTDDESDLVYHVVCSRRSSDACAAGMTPGEGWWFSRDHVAPRSAELPARYESVFGKLSAFNRDIASLPAEVELARLSPRHVSGRAAKACAAIQATFGVADALARRFQARVLWALRTTIAAVLLAGLCFILYADFDDQRSMIWGYLLFAGIGLGAFAVAQRYDWQRRYLDYRVLAESLRVQYYWALGGVEMDNPSRYSHDSFFQGRDLQLGWIRNVMRFTGLHADARFAPSDEDLVRAIDGWVGDDRSGQLAYYRHKAEETLRRHERTRWIAGLAFVLGLLAAAVLATDAEFVSGLAGNLLVALMGLLPMLAAARQTYGHRVAERELAAQYAHMLVLFENAHRLLETTTDRDLRQAILRDLGDAALNENAQWVLRQRERPLPGGDAVG